ncbi:MAG: hypothetical protein M3425_11525 [Actinomycetota bacterium]|nr:hypothetical protein [Actinomycetota bacterium]
MLQAHGIAQDEAREAAGPAWKDHDLVFPRGDGIWWNPPAISLSFARAVKAAGVNPKVVSERLGHSSVAFTLDTYAHVMPGMQAESAELFDRLVFGVAEASNDNQEEDQ